MVKVSAIRIPDDTGEANSGIFVAPLTIPHTVNNKGVFEVLVKVVGHFGVHDERFALDKVMRVDVRQLIAV